jgi:predicted TIM-barrel fold metal-dependent hydrolase
MINGVFVFDCVIHVYDLSDGNLRPDEPSSDHARETLARQNDWTTHFQPNAPHQVRKRWTVEEVYDLVFTQGGADMAMAQAVPIYDWYQDWFAPVETQYEMADKYPGEVLFCGGVDPNWQGVDAALKEIDRQARDLGARSFKFYNGHLTNSWRCDDEKIAYPMYERAAENGVKVLQFHKGAPFGKQNVEDLRPNDLQKAARDFPDLDFVIHHAAIPYFDETADIVSRFPNVYVALSGNINYALVAPMMVQQQLGALLASAGPEKILYGSEAALVGSPRPFIENFLKLEIPEHLRVGYGFPQLTDADKALILGGNFARLMGVEVPSTEQAARS